MKFWVNMPPRPSRSPPKPHRSKTMLAMFKKIGKIFQPLLGALKGQRLVILLVLLVVIALVWLVGHKISFDGKEFLATFSAKLSATLVLLIGGLILSAILSAAGKKAELKDPEAAEAKRLAAEEARRVKEEKLFIKKKITEAIAVTKAKYALPWYMVIGPENSGKTSALLNSGLKFPVNEENSRLARANVAATSRLDMYYGNQAVFLDTPGSYTEAAPKSTALELWLHLLKTLFKARPGRPLNGIIVCVSLRDLMDSDHDHREHLGRLIRDRLGEVSRHLHTKAPVYLLMTKGDAVPGFSQFFSRLSKTDREQACGAVLEDGDLKPGQIRHEMGHLLITLNSQLLHKMHEERDLPSRGSLFRFPKELAAVAPNLEDFVFEAFGESRYHPPVMFRGFFMTSSLSGHEAALTSSLDEVRYKYDASHSWAGEQERGFFLSTLFEKLFVNEAGLAGAEKSGRWRFLGRQTGKILVLGCFALALFFLMRSFEGNFSKIQMLEKYHAEFVQAKSKAPLALEAKTLIPELQILETAAKVYNPEGDSKIKYGLGLYQGLKADKAIRQAWRNDLNERFLPVLKVYAERRIRRSMEDIAELKSSLRSYLMLSKPEYLENEFLTGWQAAYWSGQYQGEAVVQRDLMEQLKAMIRLGWDDTDLNGDLLAAARRAMFKVPPPEQAYQLIKEDAAKAGRPPFMFRNVLGSDVSLFTGDTFEIPYLYTRAGFDEYLVKKGPELIRSLTTDDWIFGDQETGLSLTELDIANIHSETGRLYYRDYIKYWSDAIKALNVRRPETLAEAGRLSETLGGAGGPVLIVLNTLRTNTGLSSELMPAPKAQAAAAEAAEGEAPAAVEEDGPILPPADAGAVKSYFAGLDALLLEDGQAGGLLGAANEAAVAAGGYFTTLAISDDVDEKILDALIALADESDVTLKKLEAASAKLPPDVGRWYSIILDAGVAGMRVKGADYLNAVYKADVVSVYNASLRDRYPFSPLSRTDVSLEDFADFFRQGGQADSFITNYLKPFLSQSGALRNIMGRPLPLSTKAVEQLNRVRTVREAFFAGGAEPGLSFSLTPNTMDTALKTSTLTLADKPLSYWHGPVMSESYSWPGSFKSSLVLEDLGGLSHEKATQGEWSIFRLFQGGAVRQGGILEVRVKDHWVRYNVRYRNRVSPFSSGVYGFRPPESLR
ncbi:type VI secretion system membrane subunit TssM [Deltaproteobacteria bacterium Smac51]|nr:type VI secretion system membrane subunit TssM [Deltaproteobacteria bacterium Smac51]